MEETRLTTPDHHLNALGRRPGEWAALLGLNTESSLEEKTAKILTDGQFF